MSDIYLTKVERKTIFTQGLIYVLFTFVIADLTVTGPHIFSIIPWLFFLGIMGVNKFYHPIMTVILSTFTSFMASIFKYDGLGIGVLTTTLVTFIMTTSGLIVGVCIREFVLEHRLVKQLSIHKKILNIVVIVILTIGSILVYSAKYGNVIGYVKSRILLNEYMTETFNVEEYNIQHLKFLEGSFANYNYEIECGEYTLKLKLTSDIELMNLDEIKTVNENTLNKEMQNTVNFNKLSVKFNYEYNEKNIIPQRIVATIITNDTDDKNEEWISEVVKEIKELCGFKDNLGNSVSRLMISLDGGIQVLEQDEFEKISEEYIKDCITVETFDMY